MAIGLRIGGCCCGHPIVGNCGCSSIPDTLYMGVVNSDGGFFQPCTIQWQASPSWVTAANRDTDTTGGVHHTRLSTATFTAPSGATYYWWFGCSNVNGAPRYNITRAFPPQAAFPAGSFDAFWFAWTPGLSGNTCSPFAMLNGTDFVGAPTSNNHVNVKQTP